MKECRPVAIKQLPHPALLLGKKGMGERGPLSFLNFRLKRSAVRDQQSSKTVFLRFSPKAESCLLAHHTGGDILVENVVQIVLQFLRVKTDIASSRGLLIQIG